MSTTPDSSPLGWRTPFVILVCGTMILLISLGVRMTYALWLVPASTDLGWPRETLSFAFALQTLMWGIGTPLAGSLTDRYGPRIVVMFSGLLYAAGLMLMSISTTPMMAHLSIGVLTGFAMSGTMFPIILSAISKVVPEEKRSMYLGIASAGGSSGQVLMIPAGAFLIGDLGWIPTLFVMAGFTALIVPLSISLMGRGSDQPGEVSVQKTGEAIREAFRHRGYLLLTGGYFVCGVQTMFIGTHFPAMLTGLHIDPEIAALSLSLIGLFNILGSFAWGAMGGRRRKKYLLCWLYSLRSLLMVGFILLPITETSAVVFSCLMGLLWLGTVPLTGAIVAQIFGLRHMGMLFGFTFVGHQLGSFIGIWAAGFFYDVFGDYNIVWWAAIVTGFFASLMNFPINDTPLDRRAAATAAAE